MHSLRFRLAAAILLATANCSFAAHMHCATEDYVAGPSAISLPSTPAAITGALNVFDMLANLPLPTLGTPKCKYEISDVLSVTVHIETDQPVTFSNIIIGGKGQGAFVVGAGNSATLAYGPFPRHQNPGAIELAAPGPLIVQLTGKSNDVTILKSSLTVTGTHYYVPEPVLSGVTGAALGLLLLARRFKRSAG